MRVNLKYSVCPTPKRGDSPAKVNLCRVFTPHRKGWLMAKVNQEHFLSINQHRSCELNMEFSVFPTTKRGHLTGQGQIETYLALLDGNHGLVSILVRHSSRTRKHMETNYPPQWQYDLIRLTREIISSQLIYRRFAHFIYLIIFQS